METTQPELRTVRLQSWEWSTYYKDRHPQGVVFYTPGKPNSVQSYRSHRSVERAIQSAADLNRVVRPWISKQLRREVVFEAVYFKKPLLPPTKIICDITRYEKSKDYDRLADEMQHGSVICLVAGQHLAKTMLTHIGDRSVWSLFGNGNHLISADSRDEFIAKCNEYLVTAFY